MFLGAILDLAWLILILPPAPSKGGTGIRHRTKQVARPKGNRGGMLRRVVEMAAVAVAAVAVAAVAGGAPPRAGG